MSDTLADRFAAAPVWADDDVQDGFLAVDISPEERDVVVAALRASAPKTRKPHPGADGEAVLGEINRIASMPETEVLDLARKERLDLRLVLATQIVEERSFYGDFCPDSPERVAQEALCERMARAEGWRDAGLMFKHQTKNAYLKSDMDGWRDLCSNEGILP